MYDRNMSCIDSRINLKKKKHTIHDLEIFSNNIHDVFASIEFKLFNPMILHNGMSLGISP